MTVAALVDAGVPAAVVTKAIASMGVSGLRTRFETRQRGAFVGRGFVVTYPGMNGKRAAHGHGSVHVHVNDHGSEHEHDHGHEHVHGHEHGHAHRNYSDIRRLLRRASLDRDTRALASDIFARIAEVEAALHGTSVDAVTFHEVGAFDSIADVVGAAAAIAWLAPASIGSAPPVVGTGH
ncbi:MAG TPA: nickel insertion protein, partial [Dongiaceae bacterium]|nr:nickel insertion protein [Dongiaceae bacterium]